MGNEILKAKHILDYWGMFQLAVFDNHLDYGDIIAL